MRVRLEVVTMSGNEFVLFARDGAPAFPSGELPAGRPPAEVVREIVREWSGTEDPKLELVDLLPGEDELVLVFRAVLVDEPLTEARRVDRMSLPDRVGALEGKWVAEALKTSLNYKLTRR